LSDVIYLLFHLLTTAAKPLRPGGGKLLNPLRIARSAIIIKPSTLPRFHNALKKGKYQQLIPPRGGRKPKTACGAEAPDRSIYSGVNRFY
jgi:hypothetical protein